MVVKLVNTMGRKRRCPDSRIAWWTVAPSLIRELMKSISTIESLTTTPASATSPNMLNNVRGKPSKAWPQTGADHAERNDRHDQKWLRITLELEHQQHKHRQQRDGKSDLQAADRFLALLALALPAYRHVGVGCQQLRHVNVLQFVGDQI